MSPERWKQVKTVFEAAVEMPPPRRGSFLDRQCANDAELRAEVESLLEAHENTGGFLDDLSKAVEPLAPLDGGNDETAPIGMRVGPWELVKEIGRGGMGSVYLAHRADSEFRKRVAIKLIRHGMESPFAIKRFRNERQILATLEHANIARLIDGGTTGKGLPYLVMELVEGEPILQYCQARSVPIQDRLEIFRKVCSAVLYAHRRMIVHRDLKPANVLVKKDGSPKLLDFGVAKLLDPDTTEFHSETTLAGLRMVTPAYASPEQMRGEQATVRSDIYSLGVILSELVAGCKPAALAAAAAGALQTPARGDIHPSRVGDLRNIILRAAKTEPEQRYASVEELMADLDRYIAGLPVTAYAPTDTFAPPRHEQPPLSGSIAVLPLRLLDRQTGSDAFLATGVTDAIITRLSSVGRMSVRPTSAVLRYAGTADGIAAGYELNVEYVLEGAMQRAGTRVRASVQLVCVRTASPVWAGKFDAESGDLLQLEDSIAGQVAEAVIPQLTQEEREQLAKRGTASAKAHEIYLRGRHFWNTYTSENLAKALLCFMQAVEEDPQYAQAHSGIADYYNQLGIWGGPPPAESFAAAKAAAEKALAIDPMLAEAQASYGLAIWALDGDVEEAAHHLQMAITLNPEYQPAHLWFGMLNASRSRFEIAIASLERARRLDPRSPAAAAALARAYCSARQFGRAIQELENPLRPLDRHSAVDELLAWAYLGMGDAGRAVEAARRAAQSPEGGTLAKSALAMAEAAAGNGRVAQALLDEALTEAGDTYVSGYAIASMYLAAGRTDETIRRLAQAKEEHDWWVVWTRVDPRWDPIRENPKFRALRFGNARPGSGSVITEYPAPKPLLSRRWMWAGAAASVVLLAVAAWHGARQWRKGPPPFEDTRIAKLTTNGTAVRAAISSDGQTVAYTRIEKGGTSLWVRPVEGGVARRLMEGIEGDIHFLQFIGEGRWISFVAVPRSQPGNGTLFRVPVAGGGPERLMGGVPGPAALSGDGSKLAFLRPDPQRAVDELVVAAPHGGGARAVAARRYPDRFTWSSGPAWSPDGRRLAVAGEGTDSQGFYTALIIVDAGSGSLKTIRRPRFQYLERIAWLHDGSGVVTIGQEQDSSFQQIWYVPYPGGEPVRIGNDLNDYAGISVTADGRSIVSVQTQTLSNVYVTGPDGVTRQVTPGSGRYFDLAWTPAGRLVYASDASGSADIWIMESNGSGQRQITSGKGRSYSPAVSPNGQVFAYHSNRGGNWNIWRADLNGGNALRLTADTRDSNWPQFTPDGRYIVYHHTEPNAMFNLWKVPAEGGEPVRLTSTLTMRPAVARNGRIACWFSETSGTPTWKLAVLPPEGGAPLQVFDAPPGTSPDTPLRWTPGDDGISMVGMQDGVSNIWLQRLSGGPARPLTRFTSGQVFSFDWSRDGKLAYSHGMSSSDVVLIRDTTPRR